MILHAIYLYLFVLIFTFICGIYRYITLDTASKFLVILIGVTAICEIIAFIAAIKLHNNIPVYTIFSLIEFGLVCLYFNYSIDVFRKNYIGYYIGCAGIALGIINILFLQGLNRMNSYFLIFEGICIICLALFSFLRLFLKQEQLPLHKYHHFWFATILVFFWSVTFMNWSLYDFLAARHSNKMLIINISILIVNIITYTSISCVYILYPKMQKGD